MYLYLCETSNPRFSHHLHYLIGKTLSERYTNWRLHPINSEKDANGLTYSKKDIELVVCSSRVKGYAASIAFLSGLTCPKILFQDDCMGAHWWVGLGRLGITHIVGTCLYPFPRWERNYKKYWTGIPASTPCKWICHGVHPYKDVGQTPWIHRRSKILWPTRFGPHLRYPYRKRWVDAIGPTHSEIEFLSSDVYGNNFMAKLSTYKAVLVVIPYTKYVVLKIFETLAAGSLLLVGFTQSHPKRAFDRMAMQALGLVSGIHYLEVTLDQLLACPSKVLDKGHQRIAEEGHKLFLSRHSLNHRIKEFMDFIGLSDP